jgi:hypothetical protein
MDEEDGRPGALAAQIGHLDAIIDVPKVSLCRRCLIRPARGSDRILSKPAAVGDSNDLYFANLRSATVSSAPQARIIRGENHENVPGK